MVDRQFANVITLKLVKMEYKIVEIKNGRQVEIDLPMDITAMEHEFTFFDGELLKFRTSHKGYWMVDDGLVMPKGFEIPAKEFKEVEQAIAYAIMLYTKYLKNELRRLKDCT